MKNSDQKESKSTKLKSEHSDHPEITGGTTKILRSGLIKAYSLNLEKTEGLTLVREAAVDYSPKKKRSDRLSSRPATNINKPKDSVPNEIRELEKLVSSLHPGSYSPHGLMQLIQCTKSDMSKLLGVSASTFTRNPDDFYKLDQLSQNRYIQLVDLVKNGIEAFDFHIQGFIEWFKSGNFYLNEISPIDYFIVSPFGYQKVKDLIMQKQYGIYS